MKPNYADSLHKYYTTSRSHFAISSSKLVSKQEYQRLIKTAHVKKIADNFDPNRFGEPLVNERDGVYYLVDGQHRVAALVYMNGGEPIEIHCTVLSGLSYKEEADLFARQDDGHLLQTGYGKIVALKESGDAAAIGFMLANSSLSLRIAAEDTSKGHRTIRAAQTLYWLFTKYGAMTYHRVMRMVLETWKDDLNTPIPATVIKAVFLFDKKYRNRYEEKRFIAKLSHENPAALVSSAKGLGGALNDNVMSLILGCYNHKLAVSKKL